jgi:putative ABC transport system permease protein
VRARLREALPGDVRILTKRELEQRERTYWAKNTAIGFVFGLGMAVGFLVGMVICYQILYTNVLNDLPQFATLKAIGYTNAYLVGVVLTEAAVLSLIAFLPALVVNHFVYQAIASWTGLLMRLTVSRAALVLVLTVGMCMAAGGIAVRKVLATDPAEVF